MTIGRWTTAAAILTAVLVGCGGKVLVDGLPDGVGGHGQGQGGSGSTGGQGGAGTTCSNPPDLSTLMGCSTSGSAGTGSFSCETHWCDPSNNVFSAKCSGTTCQCLFNDAIQCTCSINSGTACTAGVEDCCPWSAKDL